MKYTLIVSLIVLANFGAFGQRPVRFEVKVPSMNCEECEQIIQDKLWKRVDGIVEIDAKWKAKKVVIKFIPDRVDSANIKLMIADLGFDASDELADDNAMKRLPECCRRVVKAKSAEAKPAPPTPSAKPAVAVPTKPTTPAVAPKPTTATTAKPTTKQATTKPVVTGTPPPKPTTSTTPAKGKKGK